MKPVDKSDIGDSFFRGEHGVQFNPYKGDYKHPNFLQEYVLKGWIPQHRFVKGYTNITAFGSCFIGHILRWLKKIDFNLTTNLEADIHITNVGEGLANPHSIYQQFEWALENKKIPDGLWYGAGVKEYGLDESIRLKTKEILLNTEVFIFTLGVSEIWEDIESGETFWKGVPKDKYDSTKHRFRVLSMGETKNKIASLYHIIKKHIPSAKIIISVSPIPFAATFRQISCITASSAGKSLLRASLDEFIRDNESELGNSLFYFPGFELIQFFTNPFVSDCRHVREEYIRVIMKIFEVMFCDTPLQWNEVENIFKTQRNINQKLFF